MKKYFKIIIFLVFIKPFISIYAANRELPILKVINEPEDNEVYSIFLILDSNDEVIKLKRQGRSDQEFYEFKKIIEGLVLFSINKKNVLFLECPNCDVFNGGEIMVRYLKNGITNQYSEIFMDLIKKNDRWGFYNPRSLTQIKTLVLKSNKLLGKVIGIKEIEINSN